MEQSGLPKKHVTFAMSERRPAYQAHAPDMHEDEDEDDKPLVRPASRKESPKEKSDFDADDGDLLPSVPRRPTPAAPVRKKEKTSSLARPSCYTGTRGTQKTRAGEQKRPRLKAEKQKVKLHVTFSSCLRSAI